MKVYLFKEQEISEKHIDSLALAIRIFGEKVEVIANYAIPEIENDEVTIYNDAEILERLNIEADAVLVAHSQTIFCADSLIEVSNAYKQFSSDKNVLIQLPIHNVMLVSPSPTLPIYGGGRFWLSGTQLFVNQESAIPIAFGDPKILYTAVTRSFSNKPYFHDFIFYNGE